MEEIDGKKLEEQANELSSNLQRIHKMDYLFFPLYLLLIWVVVECLLSLVIPDRGFTDMGLFDILLFGILLPLFVYLILRYVDKSFPKTIYYAPEGLYWITRGGKKVFVPWEDITKVIPIGDYGRIMGYGNGKVPDYMLFFRKPFPGYTPVSAEVAEKIREYMVKYKETENLRQKI